MGAASEGPIGLAVWVVQHVSWVWISPNVVQTAVGQIRLLSASPASVQQMLMRDAHRFDVVAAAGSIVPPRVGGGPQTQLTQGKVVRLEPLRSLGCHLVR